MWELEAEMVPKLEADLDTGLITWASRALERLFGYTLTGELEGLPVSVLVPEDRREGHARGMASYAESPVVLPNPRMPILEGRKKDGTRFPISIGLYPGVIGTISARRRVVIAMIIDLSHLKAGAFDDWRKEFERLQENGHGGG
jgi:PAS domain S-box-containing protein